MKKFSIYILIFSFLNYVGCYSSRTVDKEILLSNNNVEPIGELTIITNDDRRIIIDEVIYQVVDDTLYAGGIDKMNTESYGRPVNLKLATNDIQYMEVNELNVTRTVGCIIGSAGLILLIIGVIAVATYEPKSCGVKSLNDLK